MAIVKTTLNEIMSKPTHFNRDLAYKLAETFTPDDDDAPDMSEEMMLHPRVIRRKLHMTQAAFADLINIPVATLRNWEQARVKPDPAARSLMIVMAYNLDGAVKALKAHKAA